MTPNPSTFMLSMRLTKISPHRYVEFSVLQSKTSPGTKIDLIVQGLFVSNKLILDQIPKCWHMRFS